MGHANLRGKSKSPMAKAAKSAGINYTKNSKPLKVESGKNYNKVAKKKTNWMKYVKKASY